jgi:hypothetical protein
LPLARRSLCRPGGAEAAAQLGSAAS